MIKDPLRYFISEGFGIVIAYRKDGEYSGEMFYNKLNKSFMPTFGTFEGHKVMRFENIENDRYYVVDREFFEKYADISDTREEAIAKLSEYDAEWSEVIKFVKENKHLTA